MRLWRSPSKSLRELLPESGFYIPHPDCEIHPQPLLKECSQGLHPNPIGPIKYFIAEETPAELPFIVYALVDDWKVKHPLTGRGVAWNLEEASRIAFNEAIERYCAMQVPRGKYRWFPPERQPFVFTYLNIEQSCWFISGNQVSSNLELFVPIQFCIWGHSYPGSLKHVNKVNTVGFAVHRERDISIRNALQEVIEHATLLETFNKKGITATIGEKDLPPDCIAILMHLKKSGFTTQCRIHLNKFGLAVASVCLYKNYKSKLIECSGSCCRSTVIDAVKGAWLEAFAESLNGEINQKQNLKSYGIESSTTEIQQMSLFTLDEHLQLLQSQEASNIMSIWVDRGNSMTDWLGLHAVQVIVPKHWPVHSNV